MTNLNGNKRQLWRFKDARRLDTLINIDPFIWAVLELERKTEYSAVVRIKTRKTELFARDRTFCLSIQALWRSRWQWRSNVYGVGAKFQKGENVTNIEKFLEIVYRRLTRALAFMMLHVRCTIGIWKPNQWWDKVYVIMK